MTRQAAHIPGWVIRPYRAADQAAVDDLVEGGADPLWVSQGHRLHGEAREGDRWRRSLVAEEARCVIGAVTIGRNPVHPGRYNAAVEVAVGSRRRGLGTALIEQVRLLAPEARPLAGKLRPSDAAAVALAERLGGRVYQRCPGPCPDPTAADVVAWCARNAPAEGAAVLPLSQVARAEWSGLWVRQYLWVHENWSPASEAPLRELAGRLVDDADPEASTVTVRGSRVEAVTWVFGAGPDAADVVAETVERQAATGTADVAAGLSRSLSLLHRRGVRKAAIDGHVTDPHLTAVLDSFPRVPAEPLLLVELEPVIAPDAVANYASESW